MRVSEFNQVSELSLGAARRAPPPLSTQHTQAIVLDFLDVLSLRPARSGDPLARFRVALGGALHLLDVHAGARRQVHVAVLRSEDGREGEYEGERGEMVYVCLNFEEGRAITKGRARARGRARGEQG